MDEATVSIHELKARLSEYIGRTIHKGERIVITRRDKPVAMLAPLDAPETAGSGDGLEAVRWEDFAELADLIDSTYHARQNEGYRALSL